MLLTKSNKSEIHFEIQNFRASTALTLEWSPEGLRHFEDSVKWTPVANGNSMETVLHPIVQWTSLLSKRSNKFYEDHWRPIIANEAVNLRMTRA